MLGERSPSTKEKRARVLKAAVLAGLVLAYAFLPGYAVCFCILDHYKLSLGEVAG